MLELHSYMQWTWMTPKSFSSSWAWEIVALLQGLVYESCITWTTQFLLQKGADPNVEDESGDTPLLVCGKTANYAIMGLLIDAGGDPKRKNRNETSLSDSEDEMIKKIIGGER